ncbi:hypothetical protein SAMD00079811_71540 [Scytonema sp. HK-05]|uniref:hypothetical protein n=1 Tax=Scytonema sp. HK-05 TaxID=1137095 RepID=UPI000937294D|nr:hypothetical protein [Scytonema sp. HK-05]OKH55903.1 hypothetical protein NIES2130_26205 [Scytonema sp. HK-05]BAY49525.1 hypothetical protein SAMD00079811_71540 [Scytonema sp. HK-05]
MKLIVLRLALPLPLGRSRIDSTWFFADYHSTFLEQSLSELETSTSELETSTLVHVTHRKRGSVIKSAIALWAIALNAAHSKNQIRFLRNGATLRLLEQQMHEYMYSGRINYQDLAGA